MLSARCICESCGGSLTSNKSSGRNVTGKSHRQSEVPRKCICHIHEMASGVAAETRHKALRGATLCQTRRHPASFTDPPVCHLPSPLSSSLTPGCHSGAATCNRHSHRRCIVMVRDCQNKCHFDYRVLQLLWKARRSVESRALET